jgi:superfamily II DNA or RNA helicase
MPKSILCKQGYLIKKKKLDPSILNEIKRDLTVVPHIAGNYGKKPEKFKVFRENDDYIALPKYYGLSKYGKPSINSEIKGEKIDIKFKGELRDYQQNIMNCVLETMETKDGGLLSLGCGQGKTVLALYVATVLKVKTLVIVHKSFLLNQWKERAEQFTNASIGLIRQNKIEVDGKDIVIGMLQSISKEKYDEELFSDFGLVIFDEAHHAPSKYFSRSLPIIACKKTLALSATPRRNDKLEKVLFWYFGDIMYKSPKKCNDNVLVKIFKYTSCEKRFREIRHNYNGKICIARTLNNIVKVKERNKFIEQLLVKYVQEEPLRKILLLGDRIEQLEVIKEAFDKHKLCETDFYIGRMKMKQLKKAEEAKILFATYSMASEALDIPTLNTLFLITPRKNVEQAVGRILRKSDHKVQPLIVDITDSLKTFMNQGYCRRRYYKSLNYKIEISDVKNNEILATEELDYKKKVNKVEIVKSETDSDSEDNDGFVDSESDDEIVEIQN